MFKSIITTLLIVIAINPSFAQVASVMPDNSTTTSVKPEADHKIIVQNAFSAYFEEIGTVLGNLERVGLSVDDESLTTNVDDFPGIFAEVAAKAEETITKYGTPEQIQEFQGYNRANRYELKRIFYWYFYGEQI